MIPYQPVASEGRLGVSGACLPFPLSLLCLSRFEAHEACLGLCFVWRLPIVDAHGMWMIDDGASLSNNSHLGHDSQ
jgi:hypothetical protein